MQRISWDTIPELWDELAGRPAWMIGKCPHCSKVLLLLLNTQFYGDICGTHMVHMVQGPDFAKIVPWDRIISSKYFLNVVRDASPNYQMGNAFQRLPKDYGELCAMEKPRVISSREHYDRVFGIVRIMAGHEEMTLDQSDYLETLSMMVENWEDQHCEIGKDGFYAGPSEEEIHGEDKAEPGPSGIREGQE
jgi:hypothetical protein